MKQIDLFAEYPFEPWERGNHEMRRVYGPGPKGKLCRTCAYLSRNKRDSRTYLKCSLRIITNGPGTDHRAGWLACAKYEEDGSDA